MYPVLMTRVINETFRGGNVYPDFIDFRSIA
jgi:hypothetical protein